MTQTTAPTRTPVPGAGRDTRRFQRRAAALLMPVGPAAIAVLRFVLPYDTPDKPHTVIAKIAAHPGAENATLWLLFLAVFTLVPGAFTALRMVRRRAPVLGIAAAALLIPGYLALIAGGPGTYTDFVGYVGVTHGIDHGALSQVVDRLNGNPVLGLLAGIFVVGHILGTVLLAVAFWRTRIVARWAALVLGISQPLHLLAALTGSHPLDLLGWGLTAVGMGAAAVALVRLPDDEWELAPTSR